MRLDLGAKDIGLFVVDGWNDGFRVIAVASDLIDVFVVGIREFHTLLFDVVGHAGTLLLLWGCKGETRESIGFNVIWALDVVEDRAEFFTKHSPGHDAIGCDGILCEVDMVRADVHLGAPQDGAMFLEHLNNAKHFFINGGVFELCSGWFS